MMPTKSRPMARAVAKRAPPMARQAVPKPGMPVGKKADGTPAVPVDRSKMPANRSGPVFAKGGSVKGKK